MTEALAVPELAAGDGLLVADVQNDFCPGGALAVAEGDQVVPVLNGWIERAVEAGIPVFASRDWHPAGHASFQDQGGLWPAHCVQGSVGAQFHPGLRLPVGVRIVDKGWRLERDAYSPFEETDLGRYLREHDVRRLYIGGLALDYCVKAAALDARDMGLEVVVIEDAVRAVNVKPGDGRRALEELAAADVRLM